MYFYTNDPVQQQQLHYLKFIAISHISKKNLVKCMIDFNFLLECSMASVDLFPVYYCYYHQCH